MSNILGGIEFNYISEVDVPMLEQHFINRWQKRAKKINSHKQDSLNRKFFLEESNKR